MLKSRVTERRTSKGFTGQVDDALVLDVIGAYRKSLQKALPDYEKAGARGEAPAAQLRFEIEFCERFLPRDSTRPRSARSSASASAPSASPTPSRSDAWSATS